MSVLQDSDSPNSSKSSVQDLLISQKRVPCLLTDLAESLSKWTRLPRRLDVTPFGQTCNKVGTMLSYGFGSDDWVPLVDILIRSLGSSCERIEEVDFANPTGGVVKPPLEFLKDSYRERSSWKPPLNPTEIAKLNMMCIQSVQSALIDVIHNLSDLIEPAKTEVGATLLRSKCMEWLSIPPKHHLAESECERASDNRKTQLSQDVLRATLTLWENTHPWHLKKHRDFVHKIQAASNTLQSLLQPAFKAYQQDQQSGVSLIPSSTHDTASYSSL